MVCLRLFSSSFSSFVGCSLHYKFALQSEFLRFMTVQLCEVVYFAMVIISIIIITTINTTATPTTTFMMILFSLLSLASSAVNVEDVKRRRVGGRCSSM